nr:MAG TPA: hypothetical protein [Crassvirales sp.]
MLIREMYYLHSMIILMVSRKKYGIYVGTNYFRNL